MNFLDFLKKFPTEEKVIEYFIKIRYKAGLHCNHCKSKKIYKTLDKRKFDCDNCNNTFSVFKGTIFEHSSTDLRKWFYAIHLFLNGKKGISALQLQREIEVTYKCAWRILHKIREVMGNDDDNDKNGGFKNSIIEIDETYLGGKAINKHMDKRVMAKGIFKKDIIIGMLERHNKVKAKLIDNMSFSVVSNIVFSNIDRNSKIITDEHKSYKGLKKNYNHKSVNHSQGLYVIEDNIHTNNIEGFWATLKRGIYGIYHNISSKWTQSYINEFCFRYNNRNNENIFDELINRCII